MRLRSGTVISALVAMTLLAATIAGCSGDESTESPHTIGVIVSTSGTYAALGDAEKKAILLEADRVNAEGGVKGRMVRVLFADDGTDESRAVAEASRLIEQERVVALIGPTGTGPSMAIRSDIDRSAVPQVSMAGGTVVTDDFHESVFQTPWSNRLVVPFVLERLKERGITKLALLTDAGGYGKDGRAVILESVASTGLEVVADETFNPGDTDMTSQLTKIKGSGADAILLWSAGREAATVAKNRQQLQIETPLVGGPGNARREFIEGAGEAAEGFTFAAGKILVPEAYGKDTEAYAVAADFVERYQARWKKEPDIFAGHAYDAFHLVIGAIERLPDEYTPVNLRDEIEATEGFVGIGGTFTFSAEDHNGMTEEDLVMYSVKNGEWTLQR